MEKGDAFRHAYTVSEDVYGKFISLFNDRNPLHTNEEFAQGKGFAGKVMHGNILNGFLSHFVGECLPVKNVIIQSQDIKYNKPVFMEDQLELHAEIEDYFESVRVFVFRFRFINQQGVKVSSGKIQIGLI
jgi:acyl dehydratase